MSNNISIDELFQNGLSQGKEQLNLSAWANMERMLDGKNPYSDGQEPKKKRRIVPLFMILLLISTAITAGWYSVTHKKSDKNNKLSSVAQNNGYIQNQPSQNLQTQTENLTLAEKISAETEIGSNNAKPSIENENGANPQANTTRTVVNHTPYAQNANKIVSNNKVQADQETVTAKPRKIRNKKTALPVVQNNPSDKGRVELSKINSKNQTDNTESITKSANSSITNIDTIKQVTVVETVERNRDGSISKSRMDTASVLDKYIENQSSIAIASSEPLDYHITNPRYVDPINLASGDSPAMEKSVENIPAKNEDIVKDLKVQKEISTAKAVKKEVGFFDYIENVSKNYWQKLAEVSQKISSKKLILYPGMTVGLNMAVFNTQHNYGGFHIGVNNIIPISNYFSVLSELKLFYRNNSGFTVSDVQSTLVDSHADNQTLANEQKTIHSYQLDSTIRKYNFKHLYSLELPLILQFHLRNKISMYAGANFAYNFKLNTNVVTSKFNPNYIDTVSSGTQYFLPQNQSYKFQNEDFGSRFGIGYTIGASYNIKPNLYFDMRISQTSWDNSKTIYSREISDGIYKVPYFHLTLGYRFKDFVPNNR